MITTTVFKKKPLDPVEQRRKLAAAYEICTDSNRPSKQEREKRTHVGKELENKLQFLQSNDKWCLACYDLYKGVCSEVGKAFPEPLEEGSKGFKTSAFQREVSKLIADPRTTIEQIEKILKAAYQCINQRVYHHQSCIFSDVDTKVYGVVNADPEHVSFLILMCEALHKLETKYESLLAKRLREGRVAHKSIFDNPFYSNNRNICLNLLRVNNDALVGEDGYTPSKDINEYLTNKLRPQMMVKGVKAQESHERLKKNVFALPSALYKPLERQDMRMFR